ncbi:MAG: hypothetical protein Q4G29_02705 [Pseudoscardovia radai]|nr:hypothetical protein [Pseudoscardovia radai]
MTARNMTGAANTAGAANAGAPGGAGDDSGVEVTEWYGFSSGVPFVIEPPAEYLKRMVDCGRTLFIPPDGEDGDYVGRLLFSPSVSLPFPILDGSESLTDMSSVEWLFFRPPVSHVYDGSVSIEEWALTLEAYLYYGYLVNEDEGNVIATELAPGWDSVEPEWSRCAAWAHDAVDWLTSLNVARVYGFAARLGGDEVRALETACGLWDVPFDLSESFVGEVMAEGREAYGRLLNGYRALTEREFDFLGTDVRWVEGARDAMLP